MTTSTFPRWEGDTEPVFVFELCRSLQQMGIDVDVLAPHSAGAKLQETMAGINVYRYRYFLAGWQTLTYSGGILANLKRNPLNFLLVPLLLLAQALALYKRIQAKDYRLVHAHWLIPQGAICALVMSLMNGDKPALVCTSHGGDLYALNNRLFNAIKRWTLARCTHFCVVSTAMQTRALALGIPAQKTSVMPMGVDLVNRFRPVPGIFRNEKRLLFVGRLVEKKGVSILLQAMVDVVRAVPGVELLVVGDGPLRPRLERQAADTGLSAQVRFIGSIPQQKLPELYSSASISIVPSVISASGDQEGLGLVIIEALGCGCAVIASSLEAIRDVLDESNGCLARPGDANDLAKKIITLLTNKQLCQQLAENGRASVMDHFEQQVSAANYYRLITDLIAAGGRQMNQ